MLGLMQEWPLLCHRIIDHAALNHADRPIITRSVEGDIHTTDYAEIRTRALRVAQRLERDGIRLGDRVATLAWNTGNSGEFAATFFCSYAVPRGDRSRGIRPMPVRGVEDFGGDTEKSANYAIRGLGSHKA